jgi:defect-in-organelle-trafficking protein DotD
MPRPWKSAGLLVLTSLTGSGLTGCATGTVHSNPAVATPGMPNIQMALDHAITRTDAAVQQLNGEPVTTLAEAPLPQVLPAELQKPIRWSYSGPLDPAARALAKSVGYQVAISGPTGRPPIMVSVSMNRLPVIDAFRTIGIQAGARASVIIRPAHHLIEVIHYAPKDIDHA